VQTEDNQTRLYVDFDARPKGFFRLLFPIFLIVMRRQEKANMVNARAALERRLASASGVAKSTQPVRGIDLIEA
jgi:hypothetical protein